MLLIKTEYGSFENEKYVERQQDGIRTIFLLDVVGDDSAQLAKARTSAVIFQSRDSAERFCAKEHGAYIKESFISPPVPDRNPMIWLHLMS